jgi:hypothetical protein
VGFEEPPPPKRERSFDWAAIAAECRAIPGEWYKVFEGGLRSIAIALSQDKMVALTRDKGFEYTTRNNNRLAEPPTCDLYVRYVPAKDRSNS